MPSLHRNRAAQPNRKEAYPISHKHKRDHRLTWTVVLLAVLLLALLALWVWLQWGDIIRLFSGGRASPEELSEQLAASQQQLEQTARDLPLRELTAEEQAALADGSLSKDAAAQSLVDETAEDPYQKELAALMARIYTLRASYTGTLDSMLAQAEAEYSGFSAEQKTRSQLLKWAGGYVVRASDLEKSCDAEMDGIVTEMTALIKANGGDPALVDEVTNSYATEKSLKKSQYIGQLQERGLL